MKGGGRAVHDYRLINAPFEVSNGSKQVWGLLHAIIWQKLSNGDFLCGLYLGFAEKGEKGTRNNMLTSQPEMFFILF